VQDKWLKGCIGCVTEKYTFWRPYVEPLG